MKYALYDVQKPTDIFITRKKSFDLQTSIFVMLGVFTLRMWHPLLCEGIVALFNRTEFPERSLSSRFIAIVNVVEKNCPSAMTSRTRHERLAFRHTVL